jgi:predicted ATPase
VAAICRRLDGIPLAIELAAARVATLGVEGVARQLDDRFKLLTGGWRTALPRHQTMHAALDWSYDGLNVQERAVLRRLGLFAGGFTLDAASAVAAGASGAPGADIIDCVDSLVAKSLVVSDLGAGAALYRLLETTRAYSIEKLAEEGALASTSRRAAGHFRDLLVRTQAEWDLRPAAAQLQFWRGQIANVRVALDWAFAANGDVALGVDLLLAAVPLWLQLSLMDECRTRVERALALLGAEAHAPTRRNMQLHAALGIALVSTHGAAPETGAALAAALAAADALDDDECRMRALWGLWVHRFNNGAIRESLTLAQRLRSLAEGASDPVNLTMGDRLLGFSLHFLGDELGARRHLERMLARPAPGSHAHLLRFQVDQWVTARLTLAEVLWILGLPDQAMAMVAAGLDQATALDHPLTLISALARACPVALFAGDLAAAERYVGLLRDHAARHALAYWQGEARCFHGVLLIKQDDVAAGLQILRAALDEQPAAKFNWRYTAFLGELADALARAGKGEQGLATIDAALARVARSEERWCLPELMQIKGELLRCAAATAPAAEEQFRGAIAAARRQHALSWELRAATSLAVLWQGQDRHAAARDLLGSVYARFTEGFATADLRRARTVLSEPA